MVNFNSVRPLLQFNFKVSALHVNIDEFARAQKTFDTGKVLDTKLNLYNKFAKAPILNYENRNKNILKLKTALT